MLVIRMECLDKANAQRFARWLRRKKVDVTGVDGADVLVPTTYPPFVWDIADAAYSKGFADEVQACSAANAFLDGLERTR